MISVVRRFLLFIALFAVFSGQASELSDIPGADTEVKTAIGQMRLAYTFFESHKPSTKDSVHFKAATYNIGMLDGWVASVAGKDQRMKYAKQELAKYLKEEQPDVLCLQELWYESDREKIWAIANELEYISIYQYIEEEGIKAPDADETGLDILVRVRSVDLKTDVEAGFAFYKDTNEKKVRAWFERVGGVQRGLLYVKFQSKGQKILVGTTHLTPTVSETGTRKRQVESLGRILQGFEYDHVVLGVDFNFSPYFEFSIPGREQEGTPEEWTENARNYVTFFKNTGLTDAVDIGAIMWDKQASSMYTQDRTTNDLTFSLENSSTAKEPEQRLDYIWVGSKRGKGNHFTIDSADLIFDEPIEDENGEVVLAEDYGPRNDPKADEGGRLFLSDHAGVEAEITLLPITDRFVLMPK